MADPVIVLGAGASGMMAAIAAAESGCPVQVYEGLKRPGTKLSATGGGRCNLANTLPLPDLMASFGRHGRFTEPAFSQLPAPALMSWFADLGVPCHVPDGVHAFPRSHRAQSIVDGLINRMRKLGVQLCCENRIDHLVHGDGRVHGVQIEEGVIRASAVIVATGGKGYPSLGATGDGYALAEQAGHDIAPLYPAMLPLTTKETWPGRCTADTIAGATLQINLKKYKGLRATGDLIFKPDGIRGPVVQDFSREVTPLLERDQTVPILANCTRGLHEEEARQALEEQKKRSPSCPVAKALTEFLPLSLATVICELASVPADLTLANLSKQKAVYLARLLAWIPLTVTGHGGFEQAMVTRGGVRLKEVAPHTLMSKKVRQLYFCGEVLDLDGPCGGHNLHWAFASGYLAGCKAAASET